MRSELKALVLLVVPVVSLFAGPPDTLWTKTFDSGGADVGYWVEQTTDGGYILVGSAGGAGNNDVWLIKTDANGNELWNKTFGGDSSDIGHCVQQTSDGGYIIGGITRSYGAGLYDIWIIKTDSSGDTVWTRTYGGSGDDGYNSYLVQGRVSVDQTNDGGYIVAGYVRDLGSGGGDIWLIKMNSAGDTLWTKVFGGTYADLSYETQQTMDGGYIIIGITYSYDAGWGDFWLIKTDSLGNEMWNKVYGTDAPEEGWSVQQTTDGGYIAVGGTAYWEAVWLLKTDTNGDTLWSGLYAADTFGSIGYCVRQTIDGGYIISGDKYTSNGLWLVKTDQAGDTLWTKSLSDFGRARCVQQTTDSGYIVISNAAGNIRLSKFGAEPGIKEGKVRSGKLELRSLKILPSPAKKEVEICYYLQEKGNISLQILDVQGRLVKKIFSGFKDRGLHRLMVDCQDLASGTYFVEMKDGTVVSRKMMVIR